MIDMRERRYVKFKTDIYDDTKTKIIDQKPERDFIHYFFARCIVLAGKADCEGDLFMAKDVPYTADTLAIEFNRDAALVKLALDVLIDLKMIEVSIDNIYKVKSFAKHQNIKAKVEAREKDKEEVRASDNNKEIDRKSTNEIAANNEGPEIKEDKLIEDTSKDRIQEGTYNIKNQDKSIGVTLNNENNEITCNNIRNAKIATINIDQDRFNADNMDQGKINVEQDITSNSEQSNLINLETKENKESKKKKNEGNLVTELAADEIEEEPPIFSITDGDMPPLREGERLVW
jgi:predicted phage replisome organizer